MVSLETRERPEDGVTGEEPASKRVKLDVAPPVAESDSRDDPRMKGFARIKKE